MFDPTGVFYHLDNKIMIFIAAVGVVAATITTCVAANVVAPANGFSNLAPKKISYKKGVIITIIIAFFILQAWWIYGSGAAYFTWMNAYGTILAPIAAIFIADYFIVKHKRADIAALFKGAEGRYWYSGGFNVAAIIAWVLAFIFPLLTYFGVQGCILDIHQLDQLRMVLRSRLRSIHPADEDQPGWKLQRYRRRARSFHRKTANIIVM